MHQEMIDEFDIGLLVLQVHNTLPSSWSDVQSSLTAE